MQWRVRGASATTGIDATITVDAETDADAWSIASKRGMFVESVERVASSDALSPNKAVQVPFHQPPHAAPIEYSELRREAGWIAFLGIVLAIIGWFSLGLALLLFGIVVYQVVHHEHDPNLIATAVAMVPTLIVTAFFFWTASAVLRMLGFIGLAVRDIARNTRDRSRTTGS